MEPELIPIVIAVLTGIVLLVIEYRTKWFAKSLLARDKESSVETGHALLSSSNEYRETPTPLSVVEEIKALPPFQQEAAAKSYIGLKVRWRAIYFDILRTKGNRVDLMMVDESGHYPWIYSEIDVSRYPETRIVKQGHKVRITGEIAEVRGHDIRLVKSSVVFD